LQTPVESNGDTSTNTYYVSIGDVIPTSQPAVVPSTTPVTPATTPTPMPCVGPNYKMKSEDYAKYSASGLTLCQRDNNVITWEDNHKFVVETVEPDGSNSNQLKSPQQYLKGNQTEISISSTYTADLWYKCYTHTGMAWGRLFYPDHIGTPQPSPIQCATTQYMHTIFDKNSVLSHICKECMANAKAPTGSISIENCTCDPGYSLYDNNKKCKEVVFSTIAIRAKIETINFTNEIQTRFPQFVTDKISIPESKTSEPINIILRIEASDIDDGAKGDLKTWMAVMLDCKEQYIEIKVEEVFSSSLTSRRRLLSQNRVWDVDFLIGDSVETNRKMLIYVILILVFIILVCLMAFVYDRRNQKYQYYPASPPPASPHPDYEYLPPPAYAYLPPTAHEYLHSYP
jgi:hypothetical protein